MPRRLLSDILAGRAPHVGHTVWVTNMTGNSRYYAERLSADRLRKCYEVAPPRVRQYLEAEIHHVMSRIRPSDVVLELGCGYGRVLEHLMTKAEVVVGIDNSVSSLKLAGEALGASATCRLLVMDAAALSFRPDVFDVVVCIQNGISTFKVDPHRLIESSLRVTKPGGLVLLSSYAEPFWGARLKWFELQAEHGLLGEIDRQRTGNGVIVCKDGFKATTFTPDGFAALCSSIGADYQLAEVDHSSLFCELRVDA